MKDHVVGVYSTGSKKVQYSPPFQRNKHCIIKNRFSKMTKRKKPIPLTKQPVVMRSRKRAREVTTKFHKLTHERERAALDGKQDMVQLLNKELEEMGGRTEYQRASQLSTSFHSTSKWVLSHLARRGLAHGMPIDDSNCKDKSSKQQRRKIRLLEVGAINTELLDAAAEKTSRGDNKFGLDVRSIDLHSMEERIEEADFLEIPLRSKDVSERFDVIVCSMVINCVPTPLDRGKMLARLYHHLSPNGLLFLTLPKYCLTKSAFLTLDIFEKMLGKTGVGFDIEDTKQSPKVAFFVCQRPETDNRSELDKRWKKQIIRNKGKKFPNQFSLVLKDNEVSGKVWDD